MQPATLEIGLANALVLHRQYDAALVGNLEFLEQGLAQERQRMDAGERGASSAQGRNPGLQRHLTGQRGEQELLILAPGFLVAQ